MGNTKQEIEKKKKERLGEIRKNKFGTKMKIIKYNNASDIIVEFQDKYKAKVHTDYRWFKKGNVKNPYDKEVYNIGYIGKGKYKTLENKSRTKAYKIWINMIHRCYDPYYINEHLTYIDCYVCEEWHNFQVFAKWFYENYYEIKNEKMNLDKDILIKGNKLYSPETCLIVPERINTLFIKCDKSRGKYPIGVSDCCNKYGCKFLTVYCQTLEKREYLGYFPLDRPFQAFTVYKNFKEEYIKEVANEYKELIPQKLYDAMYRYEVEIDD